jgi:hypothetical protein
MGMTDQTTNELVGYWYHALASPYGLRIESPDRQFLLNQMYAARQITGDPELDRLSIVRDSRDPKVLWIVFKDHAHPPEADDAELC